MDANAHAEAYREVLADMTAAKRHYFQLKAVAEYHRKKAGLAIGVPVQIRDSGAAAPSSRNRMLNRFADSKQIDAAEAVLREAARPLKTAEIADRMLQQGFPMQENKKLRNAIFTGMTRKPGVFKKAGSGTWTLHETNGQKHEAAHTP